MNNYELKDNALINVPDVAPKETFAVGEWIQTNIIPHDFSVATEVAYQVLAVDAFGLTVQEYLHYVGQSGYWTGLTYQVNVRSCWHISQPQWF